MVYWTIRHNDTSYVCDSVSAALTYLSSLGHTINKNQFQHLFKGKGPLRHKFKIIKQTKEGVTQHPIQKSSRSQYILTDLESKSQEVVTMSQAATRMDCSRRRAFELAHKRGTLQTKFSMEKILIN